MIRLSIHPVYCFDVTVVTVYLLPVLFNICQHDQVAADTRISSDDDSCFPDECAINEFCCDGQCCSNFSIRHWFAWIILLILLSTIIITCICFPGLPWTHDHLESIPYRVISPSPHEIWNTTPYKQQPALRQYYPLATEEERRPHYPNTRFSLGAFHLPGQNGPITVSYGKQNQYDLLGFPMWIGKRCERLVQQHSPPQFNYPAPSAPPKSP